MENIKNFKGGWFLGDFEPSLLKTKEFEVAYKSYEAGAYEEKHYHKLATEYTLIIEGEVIMNGTKYFSGDIIIIEPNHPTSFEALCKTKTIVVKTPSVIGDKYLVE